MKYAILLLTLVSCAHAAVVERTPTKDTYQRWCDRVNGSLFQDANGYRCLLAPDGPIYAMEIGSESWD
jgi:hypothetical protein